MVATNFLGQNAPAIMATEALYMEMWAQDAAVMYGYEAASTAASATAPFGEPPRTTNPAGQGARAGAMVRAVGDSTTARIQSSRN